MSKKILYIGGFELPDKNAAAQRVISNGKALREIGNEVIFVGLTKSEPKYFLYEGFACHEIAYPESGMKWLHFLFSNRIEIQIIEKYNPDILIFYNYPAFKLEVLRKRYKNRKILADVTEWYESTGISMFSIVKRIDVWLRMKIIQPRTDGLIVISDFLENYYNKCAITVINIPPLVDSSEEKWQKKSLYQLENNETYKLVYAGSPGSGNKDRLDLVLLALRKIRVEYGVLLQINIIGLTKEQFVENFSLFPAEYLDDSFIRFKGRISHNEALDYVKGADFSVFLRDSNLTNTAGFPTKFVESITAGTPVITNASSNLEKYFDENPEIGFLIKNLTEEEIIHAILRAVSNSKIEIQSMKNYCFESKLFDFRKFNDRFREVV